MKIYALSLAIVMLIANCAIAAEGCNPPPVCGDVQTCGSADCCARCGCHACCEKYCRIVCEMKEIKKIVWVVKCEDFCAPLPGCPLHCGECSESGNQECCKEPACENGCDKCCNPCASIENRNYVPPKCGKVRTKKILEKKEVICKVPSYKCVVVYACANCCQNSCEGGNHQQQVPNVAPDPAPTPKTTMVAPLPPVDDTSFMK
jgi:hypothetical protein